MGRRDAKEFFELLRGKGFAQPNPRPMFPNPSGLLRLEPYSEGLRDRIWWGAGSNATAVWAARLGMNLQSSTLKFDETGVTRGARVYEPAPGDHTDLVAPVSPFSELLLSMRRASKPINTGHAQIGSCSISAIRFSLRAHAPRGGDVLEHGSEAGRAGEVAKQWQS